MYVVLCASYKHRAMDKYKFSVKFRLEQRRENPKDINSPLITKNLPINADITFNGKRLFYFTGHRIDADKWIDKVIDGERVQQVKKNNFNIKKESASDINIKLIRIKAALKKVFQRFETNGISATSASVREELKKELGETKDDAQFSVYKCFEIFIDHVSVLETWANGTKTKYYTMLNLLKEFKKNKPLYFEDMNQAFFENLVVYMINKKKNKQSNDNDNNDENEYRYSNSYISKCIKDLKRFMNWATKNGYNKSLEYKEYTPRLKGASASSKDNIFALTVDEFLQLYNLEITIPYLQRVRDVFCFCCATSLRYSDVKNLKWSNINGDYIEITTIKTTDPLTIPLNIYSKGIIDKYRHLEDICENVLPVISNEKYNKYLKTLGKVAGLNNTETKIYFRGSERIEQTKFKYELLTSHVARKTFVTLAIYLGIPSEVIRSITGHKSAKVMDRYWKANRTMKNKYMSLFNFENEIQTCETVFDHSITLQEQFRLRIPNQDKYVDIVKSDQNIPLLHLAFLYNLRGDVLKSLEYVSKLPDAMKVEFMQTISAKK